MAESYGRKVILLVLANTAFYLQNLLLLPLLTRSLGIDHYGMWSQIVAAVGLLAPLALLGLPAAFRRFSVGERDSRVIADNYASSLLVIAVAALASAAAMYVGADILAPMFIRGVPNGAESIRAACPLLVAEPLSRFSTSYFRAFQRAGIYSVFRLLQPVLTLSAVGVVLLAGHGLPHVLLGLAAAHGVLFLVGQVLVLHHIGLGRPRLDILKPFLAFGVPLLPASMINWVIGMSDRYVIGAFLPATAVGVYSAGYSLGMVVMFFFAPFRVFMHARATQLWEGGDLQGMARLLTYSNKVPVLLSLGAIGGFLALAEDLLVLLTGSRLELSPLLIPAVCLGYILFYVGTTYGIVFQLVQRTQESSYGYALGALVNVVGNVLAVPVFGIVGAAIVNTASYLVVMVWFVWRAKRLHPLTLAWGYVLRAVAAAAAMVAVLQAVGPVLAGLGQSGLPVTVLLGALVYGALLLVLRAVTPDELAYAWRQARPGRGGVR